MTTRRHISTTERTEIFRDAMGVCHLCGSKIDGTREGWELEHIIPLAMGGSDKRDNLRPAHVKCHRVKTTEDVGNIARAKRREARHIGAKAPSRNPLPGGRNSRWKKRMDGTVERRF